MDRTPATSAAASALPFAQTAQSAATASVAEVPIVAESEVATAPSVKEVTAVEEAKASATAVADDKATVVSVSESDSESVPSTPRRCGKWSAEEEAYTARLIKNFDAGSLPTCGSPASACARPPPRGSLVRARRVENGTTLRAFLSKKLNCSTMRISKKFAGKKCLGKQIYVRKVAAEGGDDDAALAALEKAFVDSAQNRPPPRAKRSAPKGPRREPAAKKRARSASSIPETEIVALLSATSSSSCSDDSLSELSEDELEALLPLAEARGHGDDVTRLISSWSYVLESFDLIHAPVEAAHDDLRLPDLADLPDLDAQMDACARPPVDDASSVPLEWTDDMDAHIPSVVAAIADSKDIYDISCPAC